MTNFTIRQLCSQNYTDEGHEGWVYGGMSLPYWIAIWGGEFPI